MTQSKARSSTSTPATRKPSLSRTAALPLSWSATEYVPRKRWWWYPILGWVVMILTSVLLAAGNWSAAALTLAAGGALVLMYLAKSRVWHYTLTPDELQLSSGKKRRVWPVAEFRGFTTELIYEGKRRAPYELLLLLPRSRFGLLRDVYLPEGLEPRIAIAQALDGVIPFVEELPGRRGGYILTQIARVLRLG